MANFYINFKIVCGATDGYILGLNKKERKKSEKRN